MSPLIFKNKEDIEQFTTIVECVFKKVWDNIAKPDIDDFLNKKAEQIDENTENISVVWRILMIVKIRKIHISLTLLGILILFLVIIF